MARGAAEIAPCRGQIASGPGLRAAQPEVLIRVRGQEAFRVEEVGILVQLCDPGRGLGRDRAGQPGQGQHEQQRGAGKR